MSRPRVFLSALLCALFVATVIALSLLKTKALPSNASPPTGAICCEIREKSGEGQITDAIAEGSFDKPPAGVLPLPSLRYISVTQTGGTFAVGGEISPPLSGFYRFCISAHDTAQLWLVDDGSAGPRCVASAPAPSDMTDFRRYASQSSGPVRLMRGRRYWIQALVEADHLGQVSVGWTLPNGKVESPIPDSRFIASERQLYHPESRVIPPNLLLERDNAPDSKPGFRQFIAGAHFRWPNISMDMSYMLYFPVSAKTASSKAPLLVFLHGNTHQGTDLSGILNEGPAQYLEDDPNLRDWFPMMALFPQLPDNWRWDTPGAPQAVNVLVKQLCQRYPCIDRQRIYLSGLSMGGKGAWLVAIDSPETYAAITVFSAPAVRPKEASLRLSKLRNIHIVCGEDDGDFVNGSKRMYESLRPVIGTRVQLDCIEHEGHSVWRHYYPERGMYEELLKCSN